VILYEMLTGERLFHGKSLADSLAAVLTREPDLERVPARARRLARRCLERDPKRRLRDIGDARFLLEDVPDAAPPSRTRMRRVLPWAIAATAAVLGVLAGTQWGAKPPPERPLTRLRVDLGAEATRQRILETRISPDGRSLAFLTAGPDGRPLLAVRNLDGSAPRVLAGTEGASAAFFSADGEWIGFSAGGAVRKVPTHGGAVVTIASAGSLMGASWGDDQSIVYSAGATGPLMRIPANGEKPAPITKVGDNGEATHRWPQVLPGSQAVLFTSHKIITGFDDATIEALNLRTGERETVLKGGYYGRYVQTEGGEGRLLYVREGALFGVRFDARTLAVRGRPVPLLEDVAADSDVGAGQFDLARNGTLVYRSGKGPARKWPLVWLDASGHTEPLVAEPAAYYTPRLSPDGKRLAMAVDHGERGREIEVFELERGAISHLTFTGEVNLFPVWSPDGKHLVFESSTPHGYAIGLVRADGSGSLQRLAENNGLMIPTSFSPDGHWLAYYMMTPAGFASFAAPFEGGEGGQPKLGAPQPLLNGPYASWNAMISPNGRWVAYVSNETGAAQVFVTPFLKPGGKWQVSSVPSNGTAIAWAPDGRGLYMKGADGRIRFSECREEGLSLVVGKPGIWSSFSVGITPFGREMSLSPDGKRFVVIPGRDAPAEAGTVHVTFVPDFFDEILRKAH
jgi:Tol biopolymer transport system component